VGVIGGRVIVVGQPDDPLAAWHDRVDDAVTQEGEQARRWIAPQWCRRRFQFGPVQFARITMALRTEAGGSDAEQSALVRMSEGVVGLARGPTGQGDGAWRRALPPGDPGLRRTLPRPMPLDRVMNIPT